MASKRRKRIRIKKQLQFELLGLLFIFISIFGSGASMISDGFIPTSLANAFRFIFGMWYFVAPIILLIIGLYLVIKRKFPKYITKRSVGFIIFFAGILLISHIQTFEKLLLIQTDAGVMKSTWTHYIAYVKGTGVHSQLGGGYVGAFLLSFTKFLFSLVGAKIVAVFSMIIGILFMTNISLGSVYQKGRTRFGHIFHTMKEKRETRKNAKETATREKLAIEVKEVAAEEAIVETIVLDNDTAAADFDVQYAYDTEENGQMSIPVEAETQADTKEDDDIELTENSAVTEPENDAYELPSPDLLANPELYSQSKEKSSIQQTVKTLESTFKSFGVNAKVTKAHVGPAVTKYEVFPEAGVKVSKILNLSDDIALALAAQDIRIEAPIPGKSAVGIEVPNKEVAPVSLKEVLDVSNQPNQKLQFALGRDISGNSIVGELNKMPHLLIAGATGSGKSVCINGIITSILMRAKPHEVKMMMIDPKKVELNVYNGIPHLLTPVVTEPKKAAVALRKVVAEMENRYELFSDSGTRNIEGYNSYLRKQNELTEEKQALLPYIVVLVDELADLMMVASNDVEDAITRLAQMARAAGIHLIIATQRPSVDVITGVIKANIPSRIAFSVSSQIDSRTILDIGGAEKLLGRGDMLYIPVGKSKPLRVQGAFLSDEEVERIVDHCINQQTVTYQEEMTPEEEPKTEFQDMEDELFDDAVALVVDMQSASVSMLQRRFRVGYTRAARLIDAMEDRGYVGPYEGNKPRVVLLPKEAEEDRQT